MNERGKSDGPVVPANPPNKAAAVVVAAEAGEERGPAKGNTTSKTRPGPSAGQGAPSALDRVREVARRDKHASLPGSAPGRQNLRQEPSAVVPHAGICAGGRPQGRSLPRRAPG